MSTLPKKIAMALVNVMPMSWRRNFRRRYYLRIVKKFTEQDWEWSAVIKPYVPSGGQVLDIGANVGYLSGLFARWVGQGGRVVSVEPIPATYDVLASSMKHLYPHTVTTLQHCLSESSGEVSMVVPCYEEGGENYYESHITSGQTAGDHAIKVMARTLDDVVSSQNLHPSLIKIDVEGHELSVIKGGVHVLTNQKPPLLIEVSGNPDETNSPAQQLFATLSCCGYQPYLISNGRLIQRKEGDASVDYLFLSRAPTH